MKTVYFIVLSLFMSIQSYAQNISTDVLSPEEMNEQPNFFLDNVEDANLPNDKGEVKLSMLIKKEGEYIKEEVWIKPNLVYQLYVMSNEDNENDFPLEVFSFPNLQSLIFPMWKFKEVPAYIPQSLKNLQYLDLQNSNITTVPESLKDMEHLDYINVTGTKVSAGELERLVKLMPDVTFIQ